MRTRTIVAHWLSTLSVGIACLLIVSGCRIRSHYQALPIPHSDNQLVGSWIGLANEDLLYKLVLSGQGTGVLYSQFPSGTVAKNEIIEWRTQGGTVTCKLRSSSYGPSLLECSVGTDHLVGKLKGKGGWMEHVFFQRERVLEKRLSRFKELSDVEDL